MDDIDALEIAEAIAARLEYGLEDGDAAIVSLTRDEAVLALGLVGALVEQLRMDVGRTRDRSDPRRAAFDGVAPAHPTDF